MTRLPADNRNVTGLEGDVYELNTSCAIRGCGGRDLERHHAWRRSFLIGDYWFVWLQDGAVVGNCINLCSSHHRSITDNVSRLEYDDGRFYHTTISSARSELVWQPPFYASHDAFINADPDLKVPEKKEEELWLGIPQLTDDETKTPVREGSSQDDAGTRSEEEDQRTCPTCKRAIPKPKVETPPEEKKPRKTWSVAVPITEQENGAEVLDELIEAARDELARAGLPYGDSASAKYYVLSTAMALFVTHAPEML